jgi:hypothetical protein
MSITYQLRKQGLHLHQQRERPCQQQEQPCQKWQRQDLPAAARAALPTTVRQVAVATPAVIKKSSAMAGAESLPVAASAPTVEAPRTSA